ncbi:unnamed protein product [Oreochromis niloticus]|nr:unnamed protein product [Mustela putorius furo]
MLFSKPQIQTQTWPVGSTVDTQQAWASAFQDCQRIQAAAPVQQVGTLRPAYRHPVMVPEHSEQVIWARAPQTLRKGQCILVEPLEGPSTVAVARSLGIVRRGRVPIKVRNLNPFPITLRRYEALATFSTENVDIQEPFEVTFEQTRPGIVEVGVHQVSSEPPGNAPHIEVMTQGKSNLSIEEQEKLNGLLRKWGDVFAADEEDYGHTDVITHSIPTVYTDNNPLVHLSTAKVGAVEQRWVAQLANYQFDIKYRPGQENVNADVLSRMPLQVQPQDLVSPQRMGEGARVQAVNIDWDPGHWKSLQEQDPTLYKVRHYMAQGRTPSGEERRQESTAVLNYMRQWSRLELLEGVLVRRGVDSNTYEVYYQILVPLQEQQLTWKAFHERNGHLGVAKTLSMLRRGFYWLQMEKRVRDWTASCERCVRHKGHGDGKAPLVPVFTHAPLQIVAVDFLTLSRPADSYQYILVATDMFTKYAWAIPTRDQTASTTAKMLLKHIIQPIGCPEQLHSDQGTNFESALIKELCQYYNCRKSRTTAYHPQGNGACERFNQTLINMLSTLEEEKRTRWVQYLPELLQAYNNSVHASTGYTPHYLMFGWNARLPVELSMGMKRSTEPTTTQEWVKSHHERLRLAYQMVEKSSQKAASRMKGRYDVGARAAPLLPGERVLVHTTRRDGEGKLAAHWEEEIQIVVGQPNPANPVYRIRPEGKDGPVRVVHRNRLRICAFLPSDDYKTGDGTPEPETTATHDIATVSDQWLLLWSMAQQRPGSDHYPPSYQSAPAIQEGLRRSARENFGKPPSRYSPGLAFIAYPQAVAMMPLPQLWSICFFVMLILLGLDTQFVAMEVLMTSFIDMFPKVLRRAGRREIFLLLFCLICFFCQLVMVTEGGMFVFQLFDYYACNGACILFLCVFETLALGWIFGADRLYDIIKDMIGTQVNYFFKLCWLYLMPLVSLGSFIYSFTEYQRLTFNRWYVYPSWAYVLGWVLALSSILLVSGWALYKLGTGTGTLSQRFHHLCQPNLENLGNQRKETGEQNIKEQLLQ